MALGVDPSEPWLQQDQFGPGSVVLLVPRRWQQTPARKPSTQGQKIWGMLGTSTPLAPSCLWLLCLQLLHPGYTLDLRQRGTGNRTTNSPSQEHSCKDRGHWHGDNPKRGLSRGCSLSALIPWVPPLHQSTVGRGTRLESALNPASAWDGHNPVLSFSFPVPL